MMNDKQPAKQKTDPCCSVPHLPIDTSGVKEEVNLLSALADDTRLQIVRMLSGLDEPLCVCDILSHFAKAQPTISHHLKVLRDARLVTWEKRGLWVYYSLNHETVAQAASYLDGMLAAAKSLALVGRV